MTDVEKQKLDEAIAQMFSPESIDPRHKYIREKGRNFQESMLYMPEEGKSPFQLNILGLLELIGRIFNFSPALENYPLTHSIERANSATSRIDRGIEAVDKTHVGRTAIQNFNSAYNSLNENEQKRFLSAAIDQASAEQKDDMHALLRGDLESIRKSPNTLKIAEKQAKAQEMLDRIKQASDEIKARDDKIDNLSGEIFLLNLTNQSLVEQLKSKPFGAPKSDIALLNTIDFDLKRFSELLNKHRVDLDVFQSERLRKIHDFREQLASVDSRFHSNSDVSRYIRLRAEFLDSLPGIEWEKGTKGHMKFNGSELGLS